MVARRRQEFAAASPFPHVVLDDVLRPEWAGDVVREFDAPGLEWKALYHVNERKLVCGDLARMGPACRTVITELQSPPVLETLEMLAGVSGLVGDPELDGSGLQRTEPGGFLNVHADHLAHTKKRTWSRQLNLILYLNPHWEESHRGWLELWDREVARCVQRIAPVFNRCVIFRTNDISLHGVPSGTNGTSRNSIALYYYRDEGRVCPLRPTRYVPLPGDPPRKRAAIALDRWLLAAYSLVKRYTPLSDALAARILRHF